MTKSRRIALAASAVTSAVAALFLGYVADPLGSNASVAVQLLLYLAVCSWPFLLRGAPRGARITIVGVSLAALYLGLCEGGCGRDGQGSGGELCLARCDESVARLRSFQRGCWTVEIGSLGRLALAANCLTAEPLRDQSPPDCASSK